MGPALSGECCNSYTGIVNTLVEAHLLLEAARVGIVPRISRRLTDAEKIRYIKPGSVFLFEEEESGILRWTDLFKWSPSRVSGSFLLYTAISDPPNSIPVDDTLIKQSFFSVDSSGARMHLIAYSSRTYRSGEGAEHCVSDDPLVCNLGLSEMSESMLESLRPRGVSTSRCFALSRTAPASNTVLLPPMSTTFSTIPANSQPSNSLPSLPLTTLPPLTSTNLRALSKPLIRRNDSASSVVNIPNSNMRRGPLSARQPISIVLPHLSARSLDAHSPTTSSSSFTSIISQMAPNLSQRSPNTPEIRVSTSNALSSFKTHSSSPSNHSRKFSSFTSYDSGSSSSGSRSLSPITPTLASHSFTPPHISPPQTPTLPRSRVNSTTSTIGTNTNQNRYQPYYPRRIASLSTSNLLSHNIITNSRSNPGGRSETPKILRRASSFNDVGLLNRNIRDREEIKEPEDFLGLRRKGSFLNPRRDPEDVRVLALLGKFSMTAF